MRDDPTCPPARVLAGLRDELPEPRHRYSEAALDATARRIAREKSAAIYGTGNPTMVPVHVLVALRTPREFQLLRLRALRPRPAKAREPLTAEERAALTRNRLRPTHRTLSIRGVLRLAREIARDEEMGGR